MFLRVNRCRTSTIDFSINLGYPLVYFCSRTLASIYLKHLLFSDKGAIIVSDNDRFSIKGLELTSRRLVYAFDSKERKVNFRRIFNRTYIIPKINHPSRPYSSDLRTPYFVYENASHKPNLPLPPLRGNFHRTTEPNSLSNQSL